MLEKIIEFLDEYIKYLHIGPFTDGPYNRDYN
jgi:hypothetical protein